MGAAPRRGRGLGGPLLAPGIQRGSAVPPRSVYRGLSDMPQEATYPFLSSLPPSRDFLRWGSTASLMTGLPTVGRSLVGLLFVMARRTARPSELDLRAGCFARLAGINKPKTSRLAEH